MDIHQTIANLRTRLSLLEGKIGPIITATGKISTGALIGVLPAHTHGGTSGGGGTLAPTDLNVDHIDELTATHGVNIEGVLLKDSLAELPGLAADPAYVDGFAIIYFYSTGGVDELRVRGKIGGTETQVTLANLSP